MYGSRAGPKHLKAETRHWRASIRLVSGMKSVILGTAGHIDHGKTALVKALTGIDADRLEEEKRRGITIDLGFAHLELAAPSLEGQGGEADHAPSRLQQEQNELKTTRVGSGLERSDRNEARLGLGFIDVPGHE